MIRVYLNLIDLGHQVKDFDADSVEYVPSMNLIEMKKGDEVIGAVSIDALIYYEENAS